MKARALISIAVAAATLAVSTATLAHDDRRGSHRHDGPRAERQMDRHGDRHDDRRFMPRSQRHQQFYGPRHVEREVIIVNRHQPAYRHGGPRWQRGQYLPREYRGGRYVVHQYGPRMYAPPRGHHWVNVNGEFLLIAAATGLIANAILNN
jgi:Ni/Co efflux regulator RcnB